MEADNEAPLALPKATVFPPDKAFVTLSEALSWIAFRVSMDSDHLHEVLYEERYGEQDPQEAVKAAVELLANLVEGGKLALRGKYKDAHGSEPRTLLTAPIDPIKLADYRQFNYLYDELRHGTGLTWWRTPKGVIDRLVGAGRRDSFIEVTVSRADLIREFPPRILQEELDLSEYRLSLTDLDELDRAAGERWANERFMRLFDAALWIGGNNPEVSAVVAGYRAYKRRVYGKSGDQEIDDRAAEWVGLASVPDGAFERGKSLLLDALRTADVVAYGSVAPDAEMKPIDAVEWSRPFALMKRNGADCLTGPELPYPVRFFDLVFSTASVLCRWPLASNDIGRATEVEEVRTSPIPIATKDEVRAWIAARVLAGDTQTAVEKTFRRAIPGKRVVGFNRNHIRDIYEREYLKLKGQPLRSGPRGSA